MKFQMFKLDLEKAEEPKIKLPTSIGSSRRRQWQPTPVLLPGESQGWRSLVGCCLWGHKELDMTETELNSTVVIHKVKSFSIINEAKVDVFLELSCFWYDPRDVGNLISGSSAFSKSSLNIWKFLVHVLLKPNLENF